MEGILSGRIGYALTAAVLLTAVGGCAVGDRAEALYLRQHRAATALAEIINMNEDKDPALTDSLYEAEGRLDSACASLRTAGYRRALGEKIDSDLEWAIVRSLSDCTATTDGVERMLWQVNPEIASFFLPAPIAVSAAPD